MAEGALEPLTRAVQARRNGREPTAPDLAACRKAAWKRPDLRCWNGKRPDRPECDWPGSQNIPVWAAAGLADWDFFVALARLWRTEGVFGREIGSPGSFYYSGVLGCFLMAYRALTAQGRAGDAEEVRLAVRAALAWDAICCLPITRTHDEVRYGDPDGGVLVEATLPADRTKGPQPPPYAVAFTGNRWSTKGRALLTHEDAHSPMVEKALRGECELTPDEIGAFEACIKGDAKAATVVSWMMYGTIDTPDTKWRFELTRTDLGVQSVFFGPYPNPMKPLMTVAQVTHDGMWRGMRPSPERQVGNWAAGYRVEIANGVIRAECEAGYAEIPELGGGVLWQVRVEGSKVWIETS